MPKRIQRKRTKGWRLPDGAICTTRPGRFGNPYTAKEFGLSLSLQLFRNSIHGNWNPAIILDSGKVSTAYTLHCEFVGRFTSSTPLESAQPVLRGKDLACFCALPESGQPDLCHAAIWIEEVNQ